MKIGIVGCAGRMGRMLMRQVQKTEGCELVGGTERAGSPFLRHDLGILAGGAPLGVSATEEAAQVFADADVVIDFTAPAPTLAHAALAVQHQTALVVGTTGFSTADLAKLHAFGKKIPLVQSFNMSLGVNLLANLVERAAAALGEDFDIEIVEMHHKHKVDAPSGTALLLGQAAAEGRKVDLDSVSQRVRDGQIGERRRGDIGFATLRGGDVVGEHTVMLAGAGERIELTHRSTARGIFAAGAVRAAVWLKDKPVGLYTMKDVLGL